MSTKTFDTETLLSSLKNTLVANLNTKIAAVEAEKIADGYPTTGLAAIDTTSGYFQQSWSDNILNISPAIFFGVADIKTEGIGAASKLTYTVFVEVILVDNGMDRLSDTRINRYIRSVKEVFEEYFKSADGSGKIKIETVVPVAFKIDQNSSEVIKVGGVTLIIVLA